jgi:hypothetical protein
MKKSLLVVIIISLCFFAVSPVMASNGPVSVTGIEAGSTAGLSGDTNYALDELLNENTVVVSENIIVNHTNWNWYNTQSQQVIDNVAAQKIYFTHASVGGNILQGFEDLHTADSSKYPLNQVSSGAVPPAGTVNGTIYEYARGNPGWIDKVNDFETCIDNGWHSNKVDIVMNKFCYIDQNADWTAYRDSMLALEAEYPDTKFVYWTMPITTDTGSDEVLRAEFNKNLRNWISEQDNKLFFDIADIEAWTPGGVHQTFISGDGTYEKLYAGFTSDGGHLNIAGSERVANGLYSLFGQLEPDDTRLVFSTQPSGAAAGEPLGTQPVVTVPDIISKKLNAAMPAVTLSITEGTGTVGAELSGAVTVNVVDGLAVFTDLGIDKAGTGYTLTATCSGYTQAVSNPFEVSGKTTITTLTSSCNPSVNGSLVTLTAIVADVSGTGTPTGTVIFKENSTIMAARALDNGSAALAVNNFTSGNHNLTAVYSGDDIFQPSTSPVLVQAVNYSPPVIITTSLTQTEGEEQITYTPQTLVAAYGTTPYSWSIAGGRLPNGLTLKGKTGTGTAILSGKPTRAGFFTFTARVKDKNNQMDDQAFSLTIFSAPRITTNSLSPAVAGKAYNQALSAEGGHGLYTWTIYSGSLPAGLDLNENTGEISGIPDASTITRANTSRLIFKVEDAMGGTAKSKILTLKVVLPVSITTASPLPNADIGTKYVQTLKASGGNGKYTWKLAEDSSLPAGIIISSRGVISGRAIAEGTYTFAVAVNDGVDSQEKEFSLTINKPLFVTTVSLPDGLKGQAYTLAGAPVILTAGGGDGNYKWTKTGTLPGGLTLNRDTGIISGVPIRAGTYTFSVKVTDGLKATAVVRLSIVIR